MLVVIAMISSGGLNRLWGRRRSRPLWFDGRGGRGIFMRHRILLNRGRETITSFHGRGAGGKRGRGGVLLVIIIRHIADNRRGARPNRLCAGIRRMKLALIAAIHGIWLIIPRSDRRTSSAVPRILAA